ncbi:MAG: hypothetical protein RR696_13645 [Clostridia bacterium]
MQSYSQKQANKERQMIHMKNGWKHLTALLLATVMLLCPLAGMTEENEVIGFEAPILDDFMVGYSVDDVADSHLTGAMLLVTSLFDCHNASLEGEPLEGLDIDVLFTGEKYVFWEKPSAITFCFYDARLQESVVIVSDRTGNASCEMLPNIKVPDADYFEHAINKGTIDGYYKVTDEEYKSAFDIFKDATTK